MCVRVMREGSVAPSTCRVRVGGGAGVGVGVRVGWVGGEGWGWVGGEG